MPVHTPLALERALIGATTRRVVAGITGFAGLLPGDDVRLGGQLLATDARAVEDAWAIGEEAGGVGKDGSRSCSIAASKPTAAAASKITVTKADRCRLNALLTGGGVPLLWLDAIARD